MGMGFGLANIGANALGGFTQGVMARDDRDIKRRKVAVEEGQLGVMQNRDKREQGAFEQGMGEHRAIGDAMLADADNLGGQVFFVDPNNLKVLQDGDLGYYVGREKRALPLEEAAGQVGFEQPQAAPVAAPAPISQGGSVRAGGGGRSGSLNPGGFVGKGVPVEKSPSRQPGGMRNAQSLIDQANSYHKQIVDAVAKAKADIEEARGGMSPEGFIGYRSKRAADLAKQVQVLHEQGAKLANDANQQIFSKITDRAADAIQNGIGKTGTWNDEDSMHKAYHYLAPLGFTLDEIRDIKVVREKDGIPTVTIGGDEYSVGDIRTALTGSGEAKSNATNKLIGARIQMKQFRDSMASTWHQAESPMERAIRAEKAAQALLDGLVANGQAKWDEKEQSYKPTDKVEKGSTLYNQIRGIDLERRNYGNFLRGRKDASELGSETRIALAGFSSAQQTLNEMMKNPGMYTQQQIDEQRKVVNAYLEGMQGGGGKAKPKDPLADPLAGGLF